MIEKLYIKNYKNKQQLVWFGIINKLNELCEVVNALVEENNIHEEQIDELQMKLEPEKCKTPVDPFAEQRKWIGKLCKFWNDNIQGNCYGILKEIDNTSGWPYINDQSGLGYPHCYAIENDDSIIYKGE